MGIQLSKCQLSKLDSSVRLPALKHTQSRLQRSRDRINVSSRASSGGVVSESMSAAGLLRPAGSSAHRVGWHSLPWHLQASSTRCVVRGCYLASFSLTTLASAGQQAGADSRPSPPQEEGSMFCRTALLTHHWQCYNRGSSTSSQVRQLHKTKHGCVSIRSNCMQALTAAAGQSKRSVRR